MKEPRIKFTENERIAANALGLDSNYTSINMNEQSIDKVIQKETLKDSLIEFTDFYEGKITFKASISIDNFVEFLHKSAIGIEKYLSKEEKLVLGN